LLVADAFAGRLADSPYFGNYERASVPWRLAVGEVDGEPLIILLHRHADGWAPHSVIHAEFTHNRITRVADFSHTPWILQAATSVLVSEPS
jgi:RNA polymerase sigma-70 factor (ECF subfamily)